MVLNYLYPSVKSKWTTSNPNNIISINRSITVMIGLSVNWLWSIIMLYRCSTTTQGYSAALCCLASVHMCSGVTSYVALPPPLHSPSIACSAYILPMSLFFLLLFLENLLMTSRNTAVYRHLGISVGILSSEISWYRASLVFCFRAYANTPLNSSVGTAGQTTIN